MIENTDCLKTVSDLLQVRPIAHYIHALPNCVHGDILEWRYNQLYQSNSYVVVVCSGDLLAQWMCAFMVLVNTIKFSSLLLAP